MHQVWLFCLQRNLNNLLNKYFKGHSFASVFEATYRIFTSTLIKDIWHQFLIILLSFPSFSINKLAYDGLFLWVQKLSKLKGIVQTIN